jgi:hypothetical protein
MQRASLLAYYDTLLEMGELITSFPASRAWALSTPTFYF